VANESAKSTPMSDIPDQIVLRRHRDLAGWGRVRPLRYLVLGLILAVIVLGLLNMFGQHPSTLKAATSRAELQLYAPHAVRGGLLFEARFTITARTELKKAALLLSPGWAEGFQINTIEPNPIGQGSHNGELLFTLGHVPKGRVYRLFMQMQVNPTNVGRRPASVALFDGSERLLTIHRTITVYP
jgi:hypothetical protein